MNEFNLIDTYFKHLTERDSSVAVGIGDDAAVVIPTPQQALVVAVDTMVCERHFTATTSPHAIGYKILAVNVSDLAAMGATPRWATLSLSMPEADATWVAEFARGLADCAKEFGVKLIGGDTTKGALAVSIQLLGEQAPLAALRRDGAKACDLIFVSGSLGEPALALRNDDAPNCQKLNYPTARLALGQALQGIANSCIDISDGLAQDLGHILDASKVGAELELAAIPVAHEVVVALGQISAARFALSAGDEYELCCTIPETKAIEAIKLADELGVALTRVGRITATADRWLQTADGQQEPLIAKGYSHF